MRKYRFARYAARRRRPSPGAVQGAPGYVMVGGQLLYEERSRRLQNRRERWRIFENIVTNTAIVAAGVRFYGDLLMGSDWVFEPSEADTTGEFAERCARMLTEDPSTLWPHVVARIGMYRYYGFSLQEWIMRADDEGYLTFDDIALRPGSSIYGWDVDDRGKVRGVIQQDPQTSSFNYMHVDKLVYVVDDVHSPSPEGLGLLRQLVEPCQRLERYEQLEGWGHDLDLRGVPIIRTPRAELEAEAKKEGADLTMGDIDDLELELRELANDHSFNPERGIILDSAVYRATDDNRAPSNVPKYSVEYITGDARSHAEVAAAIQRLKHEAASIQSMDNILIGQDGTGSYALSQDKTHSCYLMINSVLDTIRDVTENGLVSTLWARNGWDDALKPKIETSAVDHKDIYQLASAYRDIGMAAASGAVPQSAIETWFAMAGIPIEDDDWAAIEAAAQEEADELDEPMPEEPEGEMPQAGMGKSVIVRGQRAAGRSYHFPPIVRRGRLVA